MAGTVTLKRQLFGFSISCCATRLNQGLHVLLTGGCRSHIGAISTCLPGEQPWSHVFPGHREQTISEPWAKQLTDALQEPVTVVCGIHYHQATPEEIMAILTTTGEMLTELLAWIDKERL